MAKAVKVAVFVEVVNVVQVVKAFASVYVKIFFDVHDVVKVVEVIILTAKVVTIAEAVVLVSVVDFVEVD